MRTGADTIRRLGGVLLGALTLVGCSKRVLTSEYFRPEPGVFYAYGRFCGPSLPAGQHELSGQERIDFLRRTIPVDGIDLACKIHDICYAYFSATTDCDGLLTSGLADIHKHYRGSRSEKGACRNLGSEISFAINHRVSDNIDRDLEGRTDAALVRVLGTALVPLDVMEQSIDVGMFGYPKVEGGCNAPLNMMSEIYGGYQFKFGSWKGTYSGTVTSLSRDKYCSHLATPEERRPCYAENNAPTSVADLLGRPLFLTVSSLRETMSAASRANEPRDASASNAP